MDESDNECPGLSVDSNPDDNNKRRRSKTKMTDEERKARDRERKAQKKASLTPEELKLQQSSNKISQRRSRSGKSAEQKAATNEANRQNMANVRKAAKSHAGYKDACRTQDILRGEFKVLSLRDTEDSIGAMIHPCYCCLTLKFPRELKWWSMCCVGPTNGETPKPKPPEVLFGIIRGRQMRFEARWDKTKSGYEGAKKHNETICNGCKYKGCQMQSIEPLENLTEIYQELSIKYNK